MSESPLDQGTDVGFADEMAAADLSGLAMPDSWAERVMQWVPRTLASKPHVVFLIGLGVYLVVLPLFGVTVSAKAELVGGNYTNVTSDVSACIAAGGTLHLIRQGRRLRQLEDERLKLTREIHGLLHRVHPDAGAEESAERATS